MIKIVLLNIGKAVQIQLYDSKHDLTQFETTEALTHDEETFGHFHLRSPSYTYSKICVLFRLSLRVRTFPIPNQSLNPQVWCGQ